MRLLIDIGHPAHIHYFRNLAIILQKKGNTILFTINNRDIVLDLIRFYQLPYKMLCERKVSLIGKALNLIYSTILLYFICLDYKPDLLLNSTPAAAFVSWIMKKKHISIEDTFNMEQVRLYLPFTDVVLTGNYQHKFLGKKEIQYPGYQELAYLHPNRYQPSELIFKDLGLNIGDKYAVVRFIEWHATHDIGRKGISLKNKILLVEKLSKYLKVFISSECLLPDQLQYYKINIRPEQMHDVLAYAYLYIGEGATMASEAACLGTPAIYVDKIGTFYTKDQEKYGLTYCFSESLEDQDKAIKKAIELAQTDNVKDIYIKKRNNMLRDKIDVTSFFVWFIEQFPNSATKLSQNELNFKQFK